MPIQTFLTFDVPISVEGFCFMRRFLIDRFQDLCPLLHFRLNVLNHLLRRTAVCFGAKSSDALPNLWDCNNLIDLAVYPSDYRFGRTCSRKQTVPFRELESG